MKKIKESQMQDIIGGSSMPCGWVGLLAVVSIGSAAGIIIGATSGLYSDVKRCWNS